MSSSFCRLITLLCSVPLVACTSMRTRLDTTGPELISVDSSDRILVPGDWVRVTTKDGGRVEFRVTAVSPDVIEGSAQGSQWSVASGASKQLKRILLTEAVKIERSEFDAQKTMLFVVAAGAGLTAAVLRRDYSAGIHWYVLSRD